MLSTVTLFVLTFIILGLLLGIAESYDANRQNTISGEILPQDIEDRDPEVQSRLFEQCTSEASKGGELTEDEYFQCAYEIYD
ncbi:MAG: hypothetical protein MN733_37850 [Nitrososphaera sp.]|nr:hypothetical protein [Nitrososphaera sp.]